MTGEQFSEQFFFWLLALTTCGGAIAVVVSQNIVRMAFWLVVALGSVAAIYFMLHADFVGATQLMIYVGGTVVLLIFGVMLTASGPYVKIKTSPGDMVIAGGVGVLVLFLLIGTVTAVDWKQAHVSLTGSDPDDYPPEPAAGYNTSTPSSGNTARPIGLKLLGVSLEDTDPDRKDAKNLSTGYLLPFEIVSVHLLVVLIGAGYLARAKRRAGANTDVESTT
jgi:NADH:ubiquinone oxidoreductase subunit 6 (subunit J)